MCYTGSICTYVKYKKIKCSPFKCDILKYWKSHDPGLSHTSLFACRTLQKCTLVYIYSKQEFVSFSIDEQIHMSLKVYSVHHQFHNIARHLVVGVGDLGEAYLTDGIITINGV